MASLQAERFEEAERDIKKVLRRDPKHVAALNLLAIVLTNRKRYNEAEIQFRSALSANPNSSETLYNYGVFLKSLKRPKEALERFSQAIAINSAAADAWNNRGTVFNELRRYTEAIADFTKAISLKPNYSGAFSNKGESFRELKRYDDALATYDKALALKPDLAEAWLGRGNVLTELRRYDEASDAYDKALVLKPELAEAWLGRGNVLTELKRHDDALGAYERALALKPLLAEAWLGRGNVFTEVKRYEEAIAAYNTAQQVNPNLGEGYFNEACARLLWGDTERGWQKYEHRWNTRRFIGSKRLFTQPMWLGDRSIANRTVLLHAEQGLGDTIMGCRYVPRVAALGAKVILEVQPPLKSLCQTLEGASELIAKGDELPEFDLHCPLMSLPLAFKTELDTIPAKVPYFKVPDDLIGKWHARLGECRIKIGIAWAGNPQFPKDHDRSILLKNILPVCSVRGANFFSLQKDLRKGDRDILDANPHIVNLGSEANDLRDTAAIMMSLDLVISSDTSIVHLAGALGRPVWVLLSANPDWRWFLDRHDSPWYPTAKLFRQRESGDWKAVVEELRAQLEKHPSLMA